MHGRRLYSLPIELPTRDVGRTSPVVPLQSLPLYRELSALVDVLYTPAGTSAAARRRSSTFCYERHHDDVVDKDDETRLTTTVDEVSPLLTANVAVLADSAVSVEEKCLALDELLYLIQGAWTMPVIGRDVAYRVCDVLREQGGVDLLLSNMSSRTTDATDTHNMISLMSAIVLSQVVIIGYHWPMFILGNLLTLLLNLRGLTNQNTQQGGLGLSGTVREEAHPSLFP